MFLLDKLYEDNANYPIDGDYIDKFLFYRSQKDDIDVDVCEINIDNYKQTNQLISQEARKNEQRSYNKSHKKFELVDNDQIYRGETIINCMQLLLQIVNYDNKDTIITSKDFEEIINGIKNSSVLANNPKMKELLNTFVEKCYCEGNFFAIPFIAGFSLNRAKGKLKQGGYEYTFVDSSDTYFKVCRNFFVNGQSGCQLTRLIDEKYYVWKTRYSGDGWKKFVSDNFFQDFMDCDGEPLRLWNKTSEGFEKDLERYLESAIRVLSNREKGIIEKRNVIVQNHEQVQENKVNVRYA